MKKKLLLIVIVLTTSLSNAQQKLSQEQFKKIVDNMTCVCINEALENSAVDCEKTLEENEIPSSDSKTLDLYKEFQKLKNTTDSKEFSISFLTNDVYNSSKYEKIKAFANKRKSTTLEDIKEKINKKVTEVINSNSKAVTSDDQTSDSIDHNNNSDSIAQASQNPQFPLDETNSTETKSQENGLLEFMKGYGFSFILLMLITSLYLYIRRRNFASINRVESMLKENEKNRESQNKFHIPNTSNAPQNRLLEDLRDKVRILEGQIYSLEEKEKLSKMNLSIPEVIPEVNIPTVTKQEDIIFYKHAPHERGYFDTDDDVNFNDAVFKFTINRNNPNTATFEIIKDKKKLILDYPNKYIKPVCTELNALNQNANNITIVPGTVEKTGNQWIVKTKIQIKYE
jgi:hypothetical protein